MAQLMRNEHRRTYPRHGGFSLIELVMVLAIVMVLTAIAVPSYSSLTKGYRITKDADSIASLANMARMRAASDFARVQVTCSATNNTCSLQVWPYGASSSIAETQQTVVLSTGVSLAIPTGITAGAGGQSSEAPYEGSRVQTIASSIFFNSRGLPIANDTVGTPVTDFAFYLLGPNNSAMAVAIDASGRSVVYRLNGTAWAIATN